LAQLIIITWKLEILQQTANSAARLKIPQTNNKVHEVLTIYNYAVNLPLSSNTRRGGEVLGVY